MVFKREILENFHFSCYLNEVIFKANGRLNDPKDQKSAQYAEWYGVYYIIPALETKERQTSWRTDISPASPEEWILLRVNKQLSKVASLAHTEEVTESSFYWSLCFDELNAYGLESLQNGEKLRTNEYKKMLWQN